MKVRDVMPQRELASCGPETSLQQVARLMVEHDCGAIPVMERPGSRRAVGIVTDRDIVCRTVAMNRNPLELKAADVMSNPIASVRASDSLDACCEKMEAAQVRRILVLDDSGNCCGIVAQADIALRAPGQEAVEVVKSVSNPNPSGL